MRVLWANFYCLLDTSSGASISARQILSQLKIRGHEVKVLGATVFDSPNGVSKFGSSWNVVKDVPAQQFIEVNDENLTHMLMKTKSTVRSETTNAEETAWVQRYRTLIRLFRPEFIFFYGGGPGDIIPSEARAWNIPCGAYLVNGTFEGHRWCRDVNTFITDTNATRDLYRNRLNIDPFPVGKFIGKEKIAAKRNPSRLLYVNPSLAKGAGILIMLARCLERIKPDIVIEVVQSRGDWAAVLEAVNISLGFPSDACPNNVVVTENTSDMAEVYSRAKVLIVPSLWWESGARVIAEAQSNGIPVIGTARGGNAEMIGAGGFTFDLPPVCYQSPYTSSPTESSLNGLAKEIALLFEDAVLYKRLSNLALENAKITSDLEGNTLKLETHIIDLIKKYKPWKPPLYTMPAYLPFDALRQYGEEVLHIPIEETDKGIFIDCGGYDGCSVVKFISQNPSFKSITFEPNELFWPFYDHLPTTLVKKAIAGSSGVRVFTVDSIDGDGSSIMSNKAIDYNGIVENSAFPSYDVQCVGIVGLVQALHEFDVIVLKLDVEGAEYEILRSLINSGLISRISRLYVEWHWKKMGMSYADHLEIYDEVSQFCDIRDWDALELAVHNKGKEKYTARFDILKSTIGDDVEQYRLNYIVDNLI